jgi:hypothetical protein
MGRSVLMVAALLAAVLLASAPAPMSAINFGEEDLASGEVLYERWHGWHVVVHLPCKEGEKRLRRTNLFTKMIDLEKNEVGFVLVAHVKRAREE